MASLTRALQAIDLMVPFKWVDRRVVLIGLSGGGRSSAGNTILGSERFPTGSGFEPVTAEVVSKSAEVDGHWITVVDTPGFTARDTDQAQLSQRFEIMKKESEPGLHAVVFVVRIGRMSREDSVLLKALKDIFRYRPRNFSMVLFTHGDELRGRSLDQMIQSNRYVSELVSMSRNRFCVFDNSQRGNREQVREFLHHVDNIVTENKGEHFELNVWAFGIIRLNKQRREMSVAEIKEVHMERHMIMSMHMHWMRSGVSEQRPRIKLHICCGCFCTVASCVERVYRELND